MFFFNLIKGIANNNKANKKNQSTDISEKLELLGKIRSLESRVYDLEREIKLYDTREEKPKEMFNLNYDGTHEY
jgi:uncharacterized protein YlxW (UPF0749 family)